MAGAVSSRPDATSTDIADGIENEQQEADTLARSVEWVLAAWKPGVAALRERGVPSHSVRANALASLYIALARARWGRPLVSLEGVFLRMFVGALCADAYALLLAPLEQPKARAVLTRAPLELAGQLFERWMTLEGGVRAKGVVYTPPWLARELAERAVAQHEEASRGGEPERVPTMLDPACGAGNCLLASARALLQKFPGRARRELLTRVFGVERDFMAAAVARASLLLWALEDAKRPEKALASAHETVNYAVQSFDVLVGPRPGERAAAGEVDPLAAFEGVRGGFDIVLGNPPYIDAEHMTATPALQRARVYCARRYAVARGNWDLFCVFIERALELVRPGGVHGFIVPNKLLSAEYAREARRLLLARARLLAIRDLSRAPVFRGAAVYPVIYWARRSICSIGQGSQERVRVEQRTSCGAPRARELEASRFPADGGPWITTLEDEGPALLQALSRRCTTLDALAEVFGGATVAEAYALAPLLAEAEAEAEAAAGDLAVINSGLIDPYRVRWGARKMRYLGRSLLRPVVPAAAVEQLPARRLAQARQPKLVVAGMTRRLEGFADLRGEYLAAKSTTVILPREPGALEYLTAVLNSEWMTKIFKAKFAGLELAGGYLRVGPPQLRTLPIRAPAEFSRSERELMRALIRDVRRVQALHASGASEPAVLEELEVLEQALERATRGLHGL